MAKILDQFGRPFDTSAVAEPQTASITALTNTYIEGQLAGLTPARAAQILAAADMGDIAAQHRLFEDMLDRDAHLACEVGKRKGALTTLDWSIMPPPDANAAEKKAAAWVEDVLRTAVDDFEDVIATMGDATGHGFAPIELEWDFIGKERIPKFHPRPQDWFRMSPDRRELRLADGSAEGAKLNSMGWIMHTPGKAKTGYQSRMALYRVLVWPFIYKSYSIGDLAEFLETYGLPIILGKYYQGAQADEKASLMRAVTALGHDARAIMPKEMEIEIAKVTGSGDSSSHMAMVDWAERSESKAVLGQVLSAEAKATGMGSGVADLQGDVRIDIRNSDATQGASTLTRDVVYPLIAFNIPGIDGLRRCPRFVFDLGESEDLKLFSDALPKLAQGGARIPVSWVHEKLRIPEAGDGEAVFGAPPAALPPAGTAPTNQAAMTAQTAATRPDVALADKLAGDGDQMVNSWIDQIGKLLADAPDLPAFQEALLDAFGDLDQERLTQIMAAGFALAELQGMNDAAGKQENAGRAT